MSQKINKGSIDLFYVRFRAKQIHIKVKEMKIDPKKSFRTELQNIFYFPIDFLGYKVI